MPAPRGEPVRLVCASANPDKVAEIAAILERSGPSGRAVVLLPRPSNIADVVEDAPDLAGNARLKAQAICAVAGMAALADDTGLEVDALNGDPGVRSARYAGEHATYADNVAKLIGALNDVGATEPQQRTARFRTVVLVAWPDGSELMAEGVVEGMIVAAPRGAGTFGYDPVFVPVDEHGRLNPDGPTFAEMSPADKHAISHRGRALRSLAVLL